MPNISVIEKEFWTFLISLSILLESSIDLPLFLVLVLSYLFRGDIKFGKGDKLYYRVEGKESG